MSIFSSIKKSRQSAKSHKLAEQKKKEDEEKAVPYRHVPTHAATDAFASAPPGWRDADRPRIMEENRRRSAMAASGHHMNMPGAPRANSSLSYTAYPSDGATTPTVPAIPRAYSYSGVPGFQSPGTGREAMYNVPQMAYSQPYSLRGKGAMRWPIYESPDQDLDFGKDEQSVAESSSDSISSRDNLEMRSTPHGAHAIGVAETKYTTSPKRARRTSDPMTDRYSSAASSRSPSTATMRDSRPPASTRGFNFIPPSAAPPPLKAGRLPGSLSPTKLSPTSPTAPAIPSPTTALSPDTCLRDQERPGVAVTRKSRDSSATSLPGLTPTSTRMAGSGPGTPAMTPTSPAGYPFPALALGNPESDQPFAEQNAAAKSQPSVPKQREHRSSRQTRFKELERIESATTEGPQHDRFTTNHRKAPLPPPSEPVLNVFPEPSAVSDAESGKNVKGKKLRKSGKKLVKKGRAPISTTAAL